MGSGNSGRQSAGAGGLTLDRQTNQTIVIGGGLVTIRVQRIRGRRVSLWIDAPRELRVDRGEVAAQIAAANNRDLLAGIVTAAIRGCEQ